MFDIQNYGSFIAAIFVFQLIPGPGTIAILNATARNGYAAGFGAVLGTLLGDFMFMAAAVAGLAAVMKANPFIFSMLQGFGAAYLVWLGARLLFSTQSDAPAVSERQAARIYFRKAFAVSVTNPKVILFFVAFFPLFLRPNSSAGTLAAMMVHVTLLSAIYQSFLVMTGNYVVRRLSSIPSIGKIGTKISGVALIGFGIKLAANNR